VKFIRVQWRKLRSGDLTSRNKTNDEILPKCLFEEEVCLRTLNKDQFFGGLEVSTVRIAGQATYLKFTFIFKGMWLVSEWNHQIPDQSCQSTKVSGDQKIIKKVTELIVN